MSEKAYTRWGIYTSIFVSLVVCLPFFVNAQNGLVPCEGLDCNFRSLIALVENVTNFLLFNVAVPVATLLFLYAGFLFLTAGDNTGKVSQAKGIFKNVAFGFVIALGAWLFVNVLVGVFVKPDYSGGYGVPF